MSLPLSSSVQLLAGSSLANDTVTPTALTFSRLVLPCLYGSNVTVTSVVPPGITLLTADSADTSNASSAQPAVATSPSGHATLPSGVVAGVCVAAVAAAALAAVIVYFRRETFCGADDVDVTDAWKVKNLAFYEVRWIRRVLLHSVTRHALFLYPHMWLCCSRGPCGGQDDGVVARLAGSVYVRLLTSFVCSRAGQLAHA